LAQSYQRLFICIVMTISLQQVVPTPIQEKILARRSDVWNAQVELGGTHWTKLRAPSGSGKTTLIHILWQLRKDYSGQVLYNQTPANSLSDDALSAMRQQQLSVVFQDLRLFGHLTARENIELKRRMTHPALYPASRVDEMAAELGVQHVLEQQAATCSYGEQQRIAIIRALMQPFELLLMDEPFSHLDKANTARAAALIAAECRRRQAGFILTDLDDDDYFPYTQQLHL
jgi:putative ABC transport system ATP-binding protein